MGQQKCVGIGEKTDLMTWERQYWARHKAYVAGVDEVGRGCLFGDVVAAAVILPERFMIDGINDSKKLSAKKREQLYEIIVQKAIAWAIGRVDAATIDHINIKQATRRAMKMAVEALVVQPEVLLIDAEVIEVPIKQEAIIKGDSRSQSIAAASIVAKVIRDRLCTEEWDVRYPEYGIAAHKGYGTTFHRQQLRLHGPTTLHRKSFLTSILPPVKKET